MSEFDLLILKFFVSFFVTTTAFAIASYYLFKFLFAGEDNK